MITYKAIIKQSKEYAKNKIIEVEILLAKPLSKKTKLKFDNKIIYAINFLDRLLTYK